MGQCGVVSFQHLANTWRNGAGELSAWATRGVLRGVILWVVQNRPKPNNDGHMGSWGSPRRRGSAPLLFRHILPYNIHFYNIVG